MDEPHGFTTFTNKKKHLPTLEQKKKKINKSSATPQKIKTLEIHLFIPLELNVQNQKSSNPVGAGYTCSSKIVTPQKKKLIQI